MINTRPTLSSIVEASAIYKRHGVYLDYIVLQPTTFCNLDCVYCYLPNRAQQMRMDPIIAHRVAQSIAEPVTILWHMGEPLATGISHFKELLKPFQVLREEIPIGFSIQTNATLINDEWCDLFRENEFRVGVSIDGPREATTERKHRKGSSAFRDIKAGIETLNRNGIPFGVISVVTEDTAGMAREIYCFAKEIGARRLGINLEEVEGINKRKGFRDYNLAKKFWADLYDCWRKDPQIPVREFLKFHNRLHRTITEKRLPPRHTPGMPMRENSLLPTILANGDVTMFSPEFSGSEDEFIIGNIMKTPLEKLIERGLEAKFVKQFSVALSMCKSECPIYDFCKGGFPSNRYSEHGRIEIRETNNCRVHDQALVEAVLNSL